MPGIHSGILAGTEYMSKRIILFLSFLLLFPPPGAAGPNIPGFYGNVAPILRPVPPGTLPVLPTQPELAQQPSRTIQGLDATKGDRGYLVVPGTHKGVIYQNQPKAIIDWNSFDIGSDAWLHFDQKGNSDWAALNRIWDRNPTQIFGRLTADGQVYLINQNGILFAPGSQMNVHALIASSLNIQNNDFLNGVLKFKAENFNGRADNLFYDSINNLPGTVSNHGAIQTDNLGSVFLLGLQVENNGAIITPLGQTALVAGTDVELALPVFGSLVLTYPGGETRTTRVIKVNQSPPGSVAWNMEGGSLAADTGIAGMYGRIVNQDGLIRSVTAVQRGGHVELFASEKITTGSNSRISIPVSDSPEKVHVSFQTARGDVTLSGLDPNAPWEPKLCVPMIEHRGAIDAPSGLVTLNAVDRVYLAPGSRIDVSGLWVDRPAADGQLELQMNSVNLRDSFLQKGGVLQGQTIQISAAAGSGIGDVSGAFTTEGLTAVERHTAGGTVNINVTGNPFASNRTATGDIIIREGAVIDFSGGGVRYGAGSLDTTKLVAGNRVYDISAADPNIRYDSILNMQTVSHSRYGITDTYRGIFYGGAYGVKQYVQQQIIGNDAGLLSLQARQVVLDGRILGRVTRGLQQTMAADPVSEAGDQTKYGYREPAGGRLLIGNTEVTNVPAGGDSVNFLIEAITVSAQASPLPPAFQPADSVPASTTTLPADVLNAAGLRSISLAANTTITLEKGANVTLNPGGAFNARARRIESYGGITALGGSINLAIETNMTTNPLLQSMVVNPNHLPLEERIYLAGGSSLVARGERINDTSASISTQGMTTSGHTAGGSIKVQDKTVTGQGVAVMPGAVIDVSGGYQINAAGKVSGANAGSIALQGYSLIVNGDLRGQAIVGFQGGALSMHAGNVSIAGSAPSPPDGFAAGSPWPEISKGQLVLGAGQLNSSGFTRITLNSVNDIVMEAGASLGPSLARLAVPFTNDNRSGGPGAPNASGVIFVTADEIGTSSITLKAGKVPASDLTYGANPLNIDYPMTRQNLLARLDMPGGSAIQIGPGGSITMEAPYVSIAGAAAAPAGTISITAASDLVLQSGAQILAQGYNRPAASSPVKGLPVDTTPLGGGTVTLTAGMDLTLAPGSLVSVSGSAPVRRIIADDRQGVSFVTDAGRPGSISFTFQGAMKLDGDLTAQAFMDGLPGGTLSITRTDPRGALSISAGDLVRFRDGGFDTLTLASTAELNLRGSGRIAFGRSLALDAPKISGSGSDSITLSAPWVQIGNSSRPASAPIAGDATLNLTGQWLDVTGDIVISGFKNTLLEASKDIRFTDATYSVAGSLIWSGLLRTSGDLTLKAARIYPTTLSRFTVNAGGKVTILPSDEPAGGPVFSAGGSLAIQAGRGIEHRGLLSAPLGAISLQATGPNTRVYLAEGSVTATQGEAAVKYGDIQPTLGDNIWGIIDKTPGTTTPFVAVENAPAKSISINGPEVIVRDGALIDISGGGSVFTYQWLKSPSGSVNPLTKANTYVILSDQSIVLPGKAVYLAGTKEVPAGTYSILPAEFAFLPGAMILTDLGISLSTAQPSLTREGYTIVAGYDTVTGTGIRAPQLKGYQLRSAADVLKEGLFPIQTQSAGDAGRVTISGSTTVLGGAIQANPLPESSGGSIALSGSIVTVQPSTVPLPAGFGFATPAPAELAGTLSIAADSLSGKGFQTIGLGISNLDDPANSIQSLQVTLKQGVVLQAENVILGAKDLVTLEPGSQILALAASGKTGQASLISPGKVVTGAGSLIHASDAINLQSSDLDLQGALKADHSTLNLRSNTINFIADGGLRSGTGLFLTPGQWTNLRDIFENISLISASDLVFNGSFGLSVKNALTIDAGRILELVPGAAVTLEAQTLALRYTGTASAAPGLARTSQITLAASEIEVGKGNILFDTFSTVNLKALNNLTFKGAGTLATGGGDLNISTARVTTSYYLEPAGNNPLTNSPFPLIYTAANFKIDAGGAGTVRLEPGGGMPGTGATPGGTLEIKGAKAIEVSTLVEIPSGQLKMSAAENLSIKDGARLRAGGTDNAPGGSISLTSTGGGSVILEAGAVIDVSAGLQGDAGQVALYAPTGGVVLAGNLLGAASGGRGGSFSMITPDLKDITIPGIPELKDFPALNRKLAGGGFNESLDIRVMTGNISIPLGQTVRARNVQFTADGGALDLSGSIDVSQPGRGGTVELYAQTLVVSDSGTILARGTGTNARGGEVTLGVGSGKLYLSGGLIDVSGAAAGGTILFRDPPPPPDPSSLNMALSGTIIGASSVAAEVDQIYVDRYPVINQAAINQIRTDITNYMNTNAAGFKTLLLANLKDGEGNPLDPALFHFRPGVVIQSSGDLVIPSSLTGQTLDLTSWRFGGEPGTLTLRAAGNLTISSSIIDHPTSYSVLRSDNQKPSWTLNLIAGAQTGSPDLLAVMPPGLQGSASGNLTISAQRVVYTESGAVRFASAGDTVFNAAPPTGSNYMIGSIRYSLGSYSGRIRGSVSGNLTINAGSAIQSAVGDIGIRVGGNLTLAKDSAYAGTIRTTGERAADKARTAYYSYGGGGSIALDIGGAVIGNLSNTWLVAANDPVYSMTWHKVLTPVYASSYAATEGIVAMAGGDVYVRAGGDFNGQTGTFGEGNLRIFAGGDLKGRFLVKEGEGELSAMGNFGTPIRYVSWADSKTLYEPQLIEAYDARIAITAQGNVELGAVLNPPLAVLLPSKYWDNQYTPNASLTVKAGGDVNFYGSVDTSRYGTFYSSAGARNLYLPPSLDISAGRDINVTAQGHTVLMPSPAGNLRLSAGNDIVFAQGAAMVMSNADPSRVYILTGGQGYSGEPALEQQATTLHSGDPAPVSISAGRDLTALNLILPKFAEIRAGRDIVDLTYSGENINQGDTTRIIASRNIVYGYGSNVANETVELGGPGYLLLQAGGRIDLGNSGGVKSVANFINPALDPAGSSIVAVAGLSRELDPGDAPGLFDAIRPLGVEYSRRFEGGGDKAWVLQPVLDARTNFIEPLLGPANDAGDINMTASQISTTGGGDIHVLAMGALNAGKTAMGSSLKSTGIFTSTGGKVNVFAYGDVNVNESRIMTFQGGDITVWSDRGNINAGRGSKAVVNAGTPVYTCDKSTGVCSLKFTPPAVGSGIRGVSYAPGDNLPAPPPGDIYLFAPQGFIDAGEAGISGGKIFVGAVTVLNVQNISFSAGSVGVPTQTQSVNFGALSGTTNIAPKSTVAEESGGLGVKSRSLAEQTQPIEEIVMKWLDVKVIDFDMSRGVVGEEEEKKEKEKSEE